jgi:hypothetical protein
MLSRCEDQPLVQGMLRLMAEEVFGGSLPDKAAQHLYAVVASPPERAREHLSALKTTLPRLLDDDPGDGKLLRRKRSVLRVLISELVDWFVLITMLPNCPGEHMLIEYTFIDSGKLGGAHAGQLDLDVGSASSFHFELVAPDELDIRSSEATPGAEMAPATAAVGGPMASITCEGRYLSLWIHDQPRGESRPVRFELRLHRPGLAHTALLVSALTTLVMVCAALFRFWLQVHPASDVAAPVLVALPAALVALLVRETRHRLAALLAREARWSIALSSVALAIGAAAIALRFPDTPPPIAAHGVGYRGLMWCAGAALSLLVTIGTSIRQSRW